MTGTRRDDGVESVGAVGTTDAAWAGMESARAAGDNARVDVVGGLRGGAECWVLHVSGSSLQIENNTFGYAVFTWQNLVLIFFLINDSFLYFR